MVSIGGMDYFKFPVEPVSSSYVFDGQTWSSGVVSDLPEALGWSCLIKLDEDELLAVGGFDGQFVPKSSAYFYDGRKNLWTRGPPLMIPRYDA